MNDQIARPADAAAPVRVAGGGVLRKVNEGAVFEHPTLGSFTVSAPLLAKWTGLNDQAASDGSSVQDYLGAAVAPPFAPKAGGEAQYFERGMIAVRKDGRAWVVYGAIYVRYRQLGGPDGFLGLPLSDETAAGPARRSVFDGGDILWSGGTGAHEVHGAIRERYDALGGAAGVLGAPTSDEQPVLRNGQEVGRCNTFANGGGIWWSGPTGAWEVYGAIGSLWREQHGGPTGALGFPLCGETGTPDPDGRFNDFQNGVVVWHPAGPYAGAWAVFNLDFFLDRFESNFDPYHVQVKADFNVPGGSHDAWFPSDSDYATNPRPNWHAGVPVVHHDLTLDVWMDGLGHHAIGKDERLGIFQARYNIANLWGLLDHANPCGANQNRNGDFHFNSFFALTTAQPGANGAFTRQAQWWPFHNFDTAVLSYDQMAQTYSDVHEDEATLFHPFDDRFYNWLYKGSAAKGNCFGMCLEALYARHRRSIFPEPIHDNPFIQYPPGAAAGQPLDPSKEPADARFVAPINVKFGYQFGSSVVDWIAGKFLSGSLGDPVGVFHETQAAFDAGDWPILSLTKGGIGSDGHAVVPYRWDAGSKPWRMFIANPNAPAPGYADADPSNVVFVDPDANTFRLQMSGTETWSGGKSGGGMIMCVPFHLLSDQPSTPFWEVVALLGALTLILVMGDGETHQLSDGHDRGLFGTARQWVPPAARPPGVAPLLLLNRANPAAPFEAFRVSRMPPLRRAGQITAAPDLDAASLQLRHCIAPKGSGGYRWAMRGAAGAAMLDVGGGAAADTLTVDNLARGGQRVTVATAAGAAAKRAALTLVDGAQGGGERRSFVLSDFPVLPGEGLSAHLENAGQSLVLVNPGAARQVALELRSGSGAAATRPALPLAEKSVTRLTPNDWSPQGLAHTQVAAELLDAIGGKVLQRTML